MLNHLEYFLCLLAPLFFAEHVFGYGRPYRQPEGCGTCCFIIELHPGVECEITGMSDPPDTPLPRYDCFISRPHVSVITAPVKDCERLTLNITFSVPDEGADCLIGFRLTINEHKKQTHVYSYDIKLRNGNWSSLGKNAMIRYQVPDPRETSCAPHLYTANNYFVKVQPYPLRKTLLRTMSQNRYGSDVVKVPKWSPREWKTELKYEILTEEVRVWFDTPPAPVCYCVRTFTLWLVSKANDSAQYGDSQSVTYPHNEMFFPANKIEDGEYQICLRAYINHNQLCQGRCPQNCTTWFEFRRTPSIMPPSTIGPTEENSDWIYLVIAGIFFALLLLLLASAIVILYKKWRSNVGLNLVLILTEDSSNTNDMNYAFLKSSLSENNEFVCWRINLKHDRYSWRTCIPAKYYDIMINKSIVILIVCSDATEDDFLEWPSWPDDVIHEKILPLLLKQENKRKLGLLKWNHHPDEAPLEWLKIRNSTVPLDYDTNGSTLLNTVKDISRAHRNSSESIYSTSSFNRSELDRLVFDDQLEMNDDRL